MYVEFIEKTTNNKGLFKRLIYQKIFPTNTNVLSEIRKYLIKINNLLFRIYSPHSGANIFNNYYYFVLSIYFCNEEFYKKFKNDFPAIFLKKFTLFLQNKFCTFKIQCNHIFIMMHTSDS